MQPSTPKISSPAHPACSRGSSARVRILAAGFVLIAATSTARAGDPTSDAARAAISATPLRFVPASPGDEFDFAAQGLGYGLFVDGADTTLVLPGARGSADGSASLRFTLRGARADVAAVPEQPLPGVSNVYRGSDPSLWRESVPNFGRVRCAEVYAGVDLVYYGGQDELEYDFELAPGADPCAIAFEIAGADGMRLDDRGDLVVATRAGELVQHAPIAYQVVGDERVAVTAEFELEGATIRFRLGPYDDSRALVIDPVVRFSTFLGGSGADQAWDFAVDPQGYVCVAGYTASANFPRTTGGALNGFWDMYIARFDPTGSTLVYSTLLSATGFSTSITEYATGIACDASGNAYVTGRTNATDFPVWNARQPLNAGGTDAVVLKLSPSGQILYSTYHGGSNDENGRYDSIVRCGKIDVDADGFVYVTGSSNSPNFPLANPIDAVVSGSSCAGGCPDVFLTKFAPDGQSLVYSTFLGDTLPEYPVGIVVDAQRDVHIGAGNGAILLYEIAADGASILYSRTIQNGPDGGHSTLFAFDVDGQERVVLTGLTSSGSYPTTPGTWSPTYTGCFSGTCEQAFVTILAPSNGPILASTYVGLDTYNDAGTAVRFDHAGNVVFALRSRRDSGPWFGELWKFDSALSQQLAVVPMCGSGEATDLAIDANDDVRVIGWVWNGSTPVPTPGAFQTTHGGNIDVFLSMYDMQSPPPSSTFATFCRGDGSGTACPCGNDSPTGTDAGCLSSLGVGGRLASTGLASLSNDTLVLVASQMPNSSALYFQGTSQAAGGAGSVFGDGLRCAAGTVLRLGTKANSAGSSTYPEATETRISVRGAITAPGTRTYQVWYRNAAAYCSSATFNLTNGGEIAWGL